MDASELKPPTAPGIPGPADRKRGAVGVLVFAALVVYIGTLIVHNYLSHLNLRETAQQNLIYETENRAAAFAYFFDERTNDFRVLLSRREIAVFFESRALGMSREYGLDLSLFAIRRCLEEMVAERQIESGFIYERILLLDSSGEILAETAPRSSAPPRLSAVDLQTLLVPRHRSPAFVAWNDGTGRHAVLLSTAHFFKGAYAGQVLAWLRPAAVEKLLICDAGTSDHCAYLFLGNTAVYRGNTGCSGETALLDELGRIETGQPYRYMAKFTDGTERPKLAIRVPIGTQNFSLLRTVSTAAVLGRIEPWEFPVAMGVLAVLILGAAAFAVRVRVNTTVLATRLEETSARSRALQEQNRRLADEIAHNRLLNTAVEQAAEVIVITDPDGVIVYVNPAFEKVTGYTPAEALGKTPGILKSGRQDAALYRKMWETLRQGRVWVGNLTNRRKDGSLYQGEAVISPVRGAGGEIVNFVTVERDITAEVAIANRLQQAQKMEAIGELAGGVAHDFNNVLTVILGNCNLLMYGAENMTKADRDIVEEIMKAGNRAASLTRQLLAFSRSRSIESDIIDLNVVVSNTERMLRRLLRENIQFELRLCPEPTFIRAAPVQVDQIVINLAVNARDAMRTGGELTVSVGHIDLDADPELGLASGTYAVLEVADTGCGMDEQVKKRIFEPFFTTKTEGRGTGLGLATVAAIVKQSEGGIRVETEPGRGTTFQVLLPLAAATPGRVEVPDASTPAAAEAPGNRGSETILLVDDEESMVNMIQHVLTSRGYAVHAALDHETVSALWRQHRDEIDLLLTDVVMPGMSGVEIGKQLRQERKDLKVLCMTAYTDSVIADLGIEKEGMVLLQKPFTPADLASKVRQILDA